MIQLEEHLKLLPDKPGVYMMKDETGEIIYIGKAKSLRKRVRSYFRKGNHTYKTRIMVDFISDIDYILTDTEVEAFILEANLIKKYQPKYNIRLKDDKTYPYIKITLNEDFPRIYKTRIVKNDGGRYFGPYANVDAIYKTIDILKDLFSLRTCKKNLREDKPEKRPCLNYYIDKCLGPCIGAVSRDTYHKLIKQVVLFLSGHQDELIDRVKEQMYEAAKVKNFERAARFRDAMQALVKISEQQKVMSDKNIDRDVIALARMDEDASIQLLMIRNGRLIDQDYFFMDGSENEEERDIIFSFLQQYYDNAPQIPDEIILSVELIREQKDLLKKWLKGKKGRELKIYLPVRGEKRRLIEMAEQNALENLKKETIKRKYEEARTIKAVSQLGQELELEERPDHIEGFDISNIQGTDPVASMVVFKNGVPSKCDYRRFKIKTVEGPNDFAMMKEVIYRRYSRVVEEGQKLPDLILIDGGKGQLNSSYEVLCKLGLSKQAIIGLAKREEEVFFPGKKEPVIIPRNSVALYLLQRVRDESHRFAITYHRKLRLRRLTYSMLDDIPGIGPKRRQALLQHFGSLEKIKKAKIGQLKEVEGISSKTARIIYEFLRENTRSF
jgi:excinuclease ABC subunit C